MSSADSNDPSRDFAVNVVGATVRRQVEAHLRRAVISGRFAPGDHLSDRLLCEMLKVSRPVVREAIRQLEAEGLVETTPHRGSFVKALSAAEAAQIYEVRGVLEALAAKGFARNATDAEIAELQGVFDEIVAFRAASKPGSVIDLKQRFYEVLLAGCRNDYVRRMLDQIFNRSMQLRATSLSDPHRLENTIKELDALMAAIRRHDEEAAWQASLVHVRNAAKVALTILKRREDNRKAETEPTLPGRDKSRRNQNEKREI
ncbi:GntR family transcriptional regulator [Marinivivus vitaminiproducens]|uniref:GntR family transcriptional regulator n=1 Tax=Marinivivus vitaminiproducens TaxID=3035935 RepID=UPI0027A1311A|nr:GntR family transcriptional regulator [Geminicoccaceae bacterium SCSIO 64248]